MPFLWYGNDVEAQVSKAAERGLNETVADCVAYAQQPPPVGAPVWTGWLSNNITFEPAEEEGPHLIARWGNIYEPDYAVVVSMRDPYMQRAADAIYPELPDRIQGHMNSSWFW